MKSLETQLSHYADYHRDRRNIATHFVGIPMIVLGAMTLLSRPAFAVGPVALSPAVIATVLALAFYFALDRAYGIAMTVFFGATLALATWLSHGSLTAWLVSGIGFFALGWAIQFVGHVFEGKKPAFVDDIVGLLVGPLFIVAEASFGLGLRKDLERAIEKHAGPLHSGGSRVTSS